MKSKKTFLIEISILLQLALPLVASESVSASYGFFSTFLTAQLGHTALAAGSIAGVLFSTLMMFMWGVLTAVSVLVSRYYGIGNIVGITNVLTDGLLLAAMLAIPAMLLLWNISPILLWLGQNPNTVNLIRAYLHGLTWGVLPNFCGLVLIQLAVGLGRARVALMGSLLWAPVGLFFSYLLMFGKWGLPELNIAGIGWGMTIGIWFESLVILSYLLIRPLYRQYFPSFRTANYFQTIKDILLVGLPLAGMYCIEVCFFMVTALLIGNISNAQLAANQIVIQYTSFFVGVIAYCIAQAVTIRIGHVSGINHIAAMRQVSYAGLSIAMGLMSLVALCFYFIPHCLIALDININAVGNNKLIYYAVLFFKIAALFQLLDTVRIIYFGALRGLGEVKFTMWASLLAFWGVAFPVAYILAFYTNLQSSGVWWGMVFGAMTSSLLFIKRFNFVARYYRVNRKLFYGKLRKK